MSDEEKTWIICSEASYPRNLADATHATCTKCQCKVWIAPASLRHIDAHGGDPICMSCFDGMHVVIADAEFVTSDDQDKEMRASMGLGVNELYRKVFGVTPKKI